MIHARRSVRLRRAFTLIELLVVVLILAILMAVALPLYVSSVADANLKTCRANMQSISNAAHAWKVKNRMVDFTTLVAKTDPIETELGGDLGAAPLTPNGVKYSLVGPGATLSDAAPTPTPATVPAGSFGVVSSPNGATVAPECGGFVPGMMTK